MKTRFVRACVAAAALLVCLSLVSGVHAQKTTVPPAAGPADPAAVESTREQLLTLLRVSPTLTSVVASDPSLLGDRDYVARSNPELAKFLDLHPEIVRSPDFYLFADIHARGPMRVQSLERRVWSGESEPPHNDPTGEFINQLFPALITCAVIGAFIWLTKVLIANRRWSRVFRLQSDVHGKLIERFGSSQEVLTYMQTDAGKRFLEAAPISIEMQPQERWPAVLQRILLPLTAGIVLSLLGMGLLFLRHSVVGGRLPFLVFGVVTLMPGLGCILAAGITWVIALRLGLLPGTTRNGQ